MFWFANFTPFISWLLPKLVPFCKQIFLFKDTPCQCGLSNGNGVQDAPINRVINGQEALPNEFPWQVALVRAGGHTPICGGSIISDRHVLTAAHCTNDIKGISIIKANMHTIKMFCLMGFFRYRRIGSFSWRTWFIDEQGRMSTLQIESDFRTSKLQWDYRRLRLFHFSFERKVTIFQVRISPFSFQFEWNMNSTTNFLSYFPKNVFFCLSRYVRPICLPVLSYAMSQDQFAAKLVTVSGWGLHTFTPVKNGHGPYAQKLNKLPEMTVLSNRQCQALWNERSEEYGLTSIVSAMICAKKANSSACFGDSGGKSRPTFCITRKKAKKCSFSRSTNASNWNRIARPGRCCFLWSSRMCWSNLTQCLC